MKRLFIKRIGWLLALTLGAVSASMAENSFYPEPANIKQGSTTFIGLILENSQEFFGFQSEIILPEGLTFVPFLDGTPVAYSSSRTEGRGYTFVGKLVSPNVAKLGLFSLSHLPFFGNEGVLIYVDVKAEDGFEGGKIKVINNLFVDSVDKDVKIPDAISLINAVSEANSCFIPDFTIYQSEKRSVSLNLSNETPFSAFQTDLYLPEGLSVDETSFKMTSRASESHSVSAKTMENGRVRIVCLSGENDDFKDNTGAILTFDVIAKGDGIGITQIQLKNQRFSTSKAREVILPDSETTVMIEEASTQTKQLTIKIENGFSTVFPVLSSESLPVDLNLDEWWIIEKAAGNGVALSIDSNTNGVIVPPIVEDSVLIISTAFNGEVLIFDSTSEIYDLGNQTTYIRIDDGEIILDGVEINSDIVLYSYTGQLIKSYKAKSSLVRIEAPYGNTYILRINSGAIKISL